MSFFKQNIQRQPRVTTQVRLDVQSNSEIRRYFAYYMTNYRTIFSLLKFVRTANPPSLSVSI
jgi:hypothetical protein